MPQFREIMPFSATEGCTLHYECLAKQAIAYMKVGMLKIQELRRWAKQQLGARFDRREFTHAGAETNGRCRHDVLDEHVTEYMSDRLKR
jgi:uncharacterized protein (DUF885 family)